MSHGAASLSVDGCSSDVGLAFATEELRLLCTESIAAENAYGQLIADGLRHKLADMRAARVVVELPWTWVAPPQPPPSIVIPLPREHEMLWEVNHRVVPTNADGIDWTRVRRLQLRAIRESA